MIIKEDPAVPAPTRNTSASFQIPRMITHEALQSVEFDVMTHRPSSFTTINMKHTLNEYLNFKHYWAPVIHTTNG